MRFTDRRAAAPKSATRGRTIEQRIAVRWPGLAALTGASFSRLPIGSRLRRAFLERTVRGGYEAWNRDDMEATRAYADPEVEGKIVRVDMFFLADKDSVSEAVTSLAEGSLGAEAAKEPAH